MELSKSQTSNSKSFGSRPPALDPVDRENQMIAMAINEAEKRLQDGTASSQIICHYLNLATTKMKLEKEILQRQAQLLEAKTDAIHNAQRSDELYEAAIKAMRKYGGGGDEDVQ